MSAPSGNRHDGVELIRTGTTLSAAWTQADRLIEPYRSQATHVARPVDIDAARTAVIEAARGVRASIDDDEDGQIAAFCRLDEALANLDALTTKGATT